MQAPCKDCKDRVVGCHGKCEKYQEFKISHEAEKTAIYGDLQSNLIVGDVISRGVRKTRKRLHMK